MTYLLALVEEAWEFAEKEELKNRRAWLADLAFTWAATLYGQEHEETRVWKARCIQVREEEGCEMGETGRQVGKRREGWKTGGRKKNFRGHGTSIGRLKKQR